ncbi:MAG: hypothetical protein ACK5T2_19355, partial [bacterium]
YKPFACGIVIHPIIDACVQLRNEHGLTGDEIESVLAKAQVDKVLGLAWKVGALASAGDVAAAARK